jgi:uncharacterized membrane protein YfcA
VDLALFAVAGFVAQLIDGALGMAYGITCSSLLLAFGFTPASASASVHAAELVTSGISGHFHWRLGNVDKRLFTQLVWPGMIGGGLGAYLLSNLSAAAVTPWVALYLGLMGVRILYKAWRAATPVASGRGVEWLGFAGGFLDAIGGGGWGPIVTSTLVGQGQEPRRAIGSVNRAEFFVTLAQSATFVLTIGLTEWKVIAALCIGGAVAAPLGASVAKRVDARKLMVGVGLLILALSARTLYAVLAR